MEKITIDGKEYQLVEINKEVATPSEPPKRKRWRAEKGGLFWVISTDGEPYQYRETSFHGDYKGRCWLIGNYYETKEEARREADKRLAIQKIKDYAFRNWGEFVPDWEDDGVVCYTIRFAHKDHAFYPDCHRLLQPLSPIGYLERGEHAQEIIKKFPKELKLII